MENSLKTHGKPTENTPGMAAPPPHPKAGLLQGDVRAHPSFPWPWIPPGALLDPAWSCSWIPPGCSGVLEVVHECVSLFPRLFIAPGIFLGPGRCCSRGEQREQRSAPSGAGFLGFCFPKFSFFPTHTLRFYPGTGLVCGSIQVGLSILFLIFFPVVAHPSCLSKGFQGNTVKQGDGRLEEPDPGGSPKKIPAIPPPWRDFISIGAAPQGCGTHRTILGEEGKPQNSQSALWDVIPSPKNSLNPGLGEVAAALGAFCHLQRDTGGTQGSPQPCPHQGSPKSAHSQSQEGKSPKFGVNSTSPLPPRAEGSFAGTGWG